MRQYSVRMNINSFSFFKNKSGQGLPIETIIIILILLIVLVVIIVIFSDQSGTVFETVSEFLGIARDPSPTNLSDVIQ